MAKLTSEDLLKIVELYNSGMTQQEIADRYGVSQVKISIELREAGVKTRPKHTRLYLDDNDIKRISEMYRNGMTMQEIASQYGVSHGPVRDALARAGVEARPKGIKSSFSDDDLRRISEMYSNGMTMPEIAAQYDVTKSTIRLLLAKAGVQARPRGIKSSLDDDIQQISEMYNSGMSLQAIASQYSASASTIANALEKAGVERRQNSFLDADDVRQIAKMYDSGMSLREIADQYSVTHQTIANRLVKAGVKLRPGGR